MNHLSEEQLILHYYGEEGDTLAAEQHLEECDECRGALRLAAARAERGGFAARAGSRAPSTDAQVWKRIESRIPARRRLWSLPAPWRWAAASVAFASPAGGGVPGGALSRRRWDAGPAQIVAADPRFGRACPPGGGGRLPGALADGAGRAGQRQSARSAGYLRRAGARGRPGERKPPVPSDRRPYRRWRRRQRPGRPGPRPAGNHARAVEHHSRRTWRNCASGFKPKAFCSRSAFWAPTSGTRKKPARRVPPVRGRNSNEG